MKATKKKAKARKGGERKQAIEAPRGKTFRMDPDELVIPPPGHFLHDPSTPKAPSPHLVRKIQGVGWFGVATVTKLDDQVFVWLGRDRILAAREVNRLRREAGEPPITVEVQYRPCPDVASAVRLIVAENKGRRKITAAADARYALMLANAGLTVDMIAEELEVSAASVRGYLKLAEQPAFVLEAVTRGEISVAKARQLEGTDRDKLSAIQEAKAAGGAGAGKGRRKDMEFWESTLKEFGLSLEDWRKLLKAWKAL